MVYMNNIYLIYFRLLVCVLAGARNEAHAIDATQGAAALLTDGKLNVSSSDRAALNAVWKAK